MTAEGPATVTLTAAERALAGHVAAYFPPDQIVYSLTAVEILLADRVDALTADLAACSKDWNDWRDALATSVARTAAAERVIANVRALDAEWELTEFPDESTAMIMRADLRRILPAAPTGDQS
jgi:hypothetical protein